MGLFDFIKGIGRKLTPGKEADEIQQDIVQALAGKVENLKVTYDDKTDTATLEGQVDSHATREKAILLAGNVDKVEKVDDRLTIKVAPAAPAPPPPPAPVFYTIEKGDSLSKIARERYGDANKWPALFEANREVIKDPDKIYPGQQIRIPVLEA